MRLAVERCAFVGYPANYRQRSGEVYFRKSGQASRDIPLRWAGPLGRIRLAAGGVSGDITVHNGVLRAGRSGIDVHIDFADGLPCLLLEGEEFSTVPRGRRASTVNIGWRRRQARAAIRCVHRMPRGKTPCPCRSAAAFSPRAVPVPVIPWRHAGTWCSTSRRRNSGLCGSKRAGAAS
jgi:hypothetical protein